MIVVALVHPFTWAVRSRLSAALFAQIYGSADVLSRGTWFMNVAPPSIMDRRITALRRAGTGVEFHRYNC